MQSKWMKAAIAAGILISTVGCASKEPPSCSDERTLSLVRDLVMDQIGGREGLTDAEVSSNLVFELVRPSAIDEKIRKLSCEARLVAGQYYQVPVQYESQLDDSGQHVVRIYGIRNGDLRGIHTGMAQAITKSRAENSAGNLKQQSAGAGREDAGKDCRQLSSYVERMICGDDRVKRLDTILSQNYENMSNSDLDEGVRSHLRNSQAEWKLERDRCSSLECLESIYRERIDSICDYPVASGLYPVCTSSEEIL